MTSSYLAHEALFCRVFTQCVINWNNVEEAAQQILGAYVSGGLGSFVVLHHLQNVALQDALLATADLLEMPESELTQRNADHIRHFVEGFDVLRVYRNFYVHSIKAIISDPDDRTLCVGMLMQTEAKKRLAWINHTLTFQEISEFLGHVKELRDYGQGVAAFIKPLDQLNAFALLVKPQSLPEKPIWPERLKKSRTYLTDTLPQPAASPESR